MGLNLLSEVRFNKEIVSNHIFYRWPLLLTAFPFLADQRYFIVETVIIHSEEERAMTDSRDVGCGSTRQSSWSD